MPIVKSGKGREIKIPEEVWDSLNLESGDFFEVIEENGRIVLSPRKDVDEDELDFWSEESQVGIAEGLEELKSGKSKRFENVDDLIEDLDS